MIIHENVASFVIDLESLADDLVVEEVLLLKQAIGMHVLRGVTLKTPVDKGRARANNHVSVGRESFAQFKMTDKGGEKTISRGSKRIESDKDPFAILFVQNNLPYIVRLENGWSDQARDPDGMYERTFNEVEEMFT